METPAHEFSGGHTIVAGYGLPGRAVADLLHSQGVEHCVIELNPTTVHRCERTTPIIEGDCTDPEVLHRAGIQHATTIVIVVPDERAALEATAQARKLNPSIQILTRCHYTSKGIEARARGANEVIVEEQVVAAEASKWILSQMNLADEHR